LAEKSNKYLSISRIKLENKNQKGNKKLEAQWVEPVLLTFHSVLPPQAILVSDWPMFKNLLL
jgi:hypothetical protein